MYRKAIIVILAVIPLAAAWWYAGRGRAVAAEPAAARAPRQNVELTVYAQDFGMVHEQRPVQLSAGTNHLRLVDVSRELDPHSVLLQWQNETPNGPQVVAHAYDLGVANGDGLLKRYLGQDVEVVRYGTNGHEAERQKGTLMVEANGEVVLQADGKFYVHPPGTIVAPSTGQIVPLPQLSVQAESPAAQPAALDVAYLTRGLSWSADYVATLSQQTSALKLECYATVVNRTGVDYPGAKVSLVAGTPNRAVRTLEASASKDLSDHLFMDGKTKAMGTRQRALANGVEAPQSVGDFYVYPIKAPTTVAHEQLNRLLILSGKSVPVHKDYSTHPPQLSAWDDYYGNWGTASQPVHGNVQAAMSFYNRTQDGLGAPLPSGDVRIYEPDRAGSLRYAGAATIRNTPVDQKIDIALSRAFDLFTEGRVVKRSQPNRHTVRKQVELVLHNEKAVPADLRVVQGFGGRWKIVGESHKHVGLDAYTAQWTVSVPAGGKITLTYTVDLPC